MELCSIVLSNWIALKLLAFAGPGTSFCHVGVDAPPCPCAPGQTATLGYGCGNSVFPGGAILTATGIASPIGSDSVQFMMSDVPPGTATLYFQGDLPMVPGVHFGDGDTCITGTITRLGLKFDNGGVQPMGFNDAAIDNTTTIGPASGDQPISVLGAIPTSGGTYYYACFYRNPVASWCPTATFNLSQAYQITW